MRTLIDPESPALKKATLWDKLMRIHWPLYLLALSAALIGVACIYSATWTSDRPEMRMAFQRQAMWVSIGAATSLVISLIDYKKLLHFAWGYLVIGFALLVVTLAIGQEIHGAKSWINLGPMSLQPAEFTKICFILFLSWYLGLRGKDVKTFQTFFVSCAVMGAFMLLILKQPDLGSAAVFAPICFLMMFVAGVSKRWLIVGLMTGVVGFVMAFLFVLKEYQKLRLITFLNPGHDLAGAGYHLNQSKIAIGSGGLLGKGYMEGTQNMLGFLPRDVSFSDFIFSVIGEEFGFLGSGALVIGYALLLLTGLSIASRAKDTEGMLLCAGVVGMIFAHVFENIGMTIGVTPITGIPLPFISYGGTFILACFIGIGLMQSVHVHRGRLS